MPFRDGENNLPIDSEVTGAEILVGRNADDQPVEVPLTAILASTVASTAMLGPLHALTGHTATIPPGHAVVGTHADVTAFRAAVPAAYAGQRVRLAGHPEGYYIAEFISQPLSGGGFEWRETAVTADFEGELNSKASRVLTRRVVTGNYTLVLADATDMVLHVTAGSNLDITLPSDAAVAIPEEMSIPWRQFGTGQITFVAGASTTLIARGSAFKSAGQYAEGIVTKVAANTWLLTGDITA